MPWSGSNLLITGITSQYLFWIFQFAGRTIVKKIIIDSAGNWF